MASGGTGAVLRGAGLPVTSIEDLGAHAEMLDGRVKTLQPQIHGGILARRDAAHLAELETNNIRAIDVVVVNLYPFEETVARGHVTPEEAIEQIDIDPQGTDFQRAVWQAIREVPAGQTASYQEIAQAVGKPSAYRAVGTATGRNPLGIAVPCHRIVRSDGGLGGYGGGLDRKEWFLEHERKHLKTGKNGHD